MAKPLRYKKNAVPASSFKRLIAFLIDMLIINLALAAPFRGVLSDLVPSTSVAENIQILQSGTGMIKQLYLAVFFLTLIALLYHVLMEYYLKQTPGMMLMKIAVESEKKLVFVQCVLRNLFIIPFFPFFFLWLIEPLHMFFDPKSRRFMEKISRTAVVQKQPMFTGMV